MFMPGVHRGLKKVLDPRELEFQMVMIHQVGARLGIPFRLSLRAISAEPSLQPLERVF